MKTFAIRDGDLALGPGGFSLVTGTEKLRQDLSLALREPFGSDPYHPLWGSLLDTYIGEPIDGTLLARIRSEVERIVGNYVAIQGAILQANRAAGKRPSFGSGEVIREVTSVQASASFDSIIVRVNLRTYDGQEVELIQQIGST